MDSSTFASSSKSIPPNRQQRQTKIQDTFKAVKPMSRNYKKVNNPISTPTKKLRADSDYIDDSEEEQLAPKVTAQNFKSSPPKISKTKALDMSSMSERQVLARLNMEKVQLMKRLSLYGINPESEMLDRALQSFSTTGAQSGMTVESFLHSLASTSASPSQGPAFSTLESPSTPALLHSSISDRRSSSTSSRRKSSASSGPPEPRTPPPTSNIQLESQERTPYYRKNDRLMAFKPSIAPSNPAVAPLIKSATQSDLPTELVAAQVHGMGRIIISKNILMETFGKKATEKVIEDAAVKQSIIGFGESSQKNLNESLPILESFASERNSGLGKGLEAPAMLIDDRMSSIKLWLDSPEMAEEDSRSTWSFTPKEWDQDLDRFKQLTSKNDQSLLSPLGDGPGEPEFVQEIRVGGKSVKVLLKTKKRRVEELGECFDESDRIMRDAALVDVKGKGKATCICGQGQGESMLQCDDCRTWFHSECLNISNRRLSSEWFCFRCTGGNLPTIPRTQSYGGSGLLHKPQHPAHSLKRNKSTGAIPTTPTLSYDEPTLVETAFTPVSCGNFYNTGKPDMALAPSPQSSPIAARRIPSIHYSPSHSRSHSGTSQLLLPIAPGTNLRIYPGAGGAGSMNSNFREIRNDYSPRSPTFSRVNRTRVISTGQQLFEEQTLQSQNWVAGGEGIIFESNLPNGIPLVDEDDFHAKNSWDLNSTPSRLLDRDAFGISTPLTSSRRAHLTPAQDFLSGLHGGRDDSNQNYSQYAQKLFSHSGILAPPSNTFLPPSPDSAGRNPSQQQYYNPTMSNFNYGGRNLGSPQMGGHRRVPSTGFGSGFGSSNLGFFQEE